MARKRTPSPEQQAHDRSQVAACAQILAPLATRYPVALENAVTLLRSFAASKVELPAKRKASAKAKPADYADAVANQRRYLEAAGLDSK